MHTVVVADLVGSSATTGQRHQWMREDLFKLTAGALRRRQFDLGSLRPDDTGDGLRLVVPFSRIPAADLVDILVLGLLAELREHRAYTAEGSRLRLRLAFDMGLVERHLRGWVGEPIVRAQRLVDAEPLRLTFKDDPGLDLAVITSDVMYHSVVEPGGGYVPASCFRPVYVEVKEFAAGAWVLVPDIPWRCRGCDGRAA